MTLLLEAGADPSAMTHAGDTPAMLAYAREHGPLVELLEKAAGMRRGASIGDEVVCQTKLPTKARPEERLEGRCEGRRVV